MAERDVLEDQIDARMEALSHSGPPTTMGARRRLILETVELAPHGERLEAAVPQAGAHARCSELCEDVAHGMGDTQAVG